MDEITKEMLTFRNQMKLYHWKTALYSRHKTSDKFLSLMDEHIDKFIEVLSGSRNSRPRDNFKIEFETLTDKTVMDYLENFKGWLVDSLPGMLFEHETDLLNLRDEILSDLNRVLYLFRLK